MTNPRRPVDYRQCPRIHGHSPFPVPAAAGESAWHVGVRTFYAAPTTAFAAEQRSTSADERESTTTVPDLDTRVHGYQHWGVRWRPRLRTELRPTGKEF
jgi:hypothetical protein